MLVDKLTQLYIQHVGSVSDRQIDLHDALPDQHAHQLDVAQGTLRLGESVIPAQLLGSWSSLDNSWTWAWSWSDLPDTVLGAAQSMRRLGEELEIPELVNQKVIDETISGHTLAVIATGMLNADAYYVCPCEGSDMFVLLPTVQHDRPPVRPLVRVMSGFPQAVDRYQIEDQRAALVAYCGDVGLTVETSGEAMRIFDESGELTATFDSADQLVSITGMLRSPSVKEPKRRRFFKRSAR